MDKHIPERRIHKRFNVEIGALTLLECNSSKELGEIINISRGGLAYRYISNGGSPVGPSEFDIFWAGNRRLLRAATCEAISDYKLSKKFPIGFNKSQVRGVKFTDLTEQQISQLEYCLQKHTIIEE